MFVGSSAGNARVKLSNRWTYKTHGSIGTIQLRRPDVESVPCLHNCGVCRMKCRPKTIDSMRHFLCRCPGEMRVRSILPRRKKVRGRIYTGLAMRVAIITVEVAVIVRTAGGCCLEASSHVGSKPIFGCEVV
jgi:hypothetical protein